MKTYEIYVTNCLIAIEKLTPEQVKSMNKDNMIRLVSVEK